MQATSVEQTAPPRFMYEKSYVLDRATRHESGDNARGWSVNGKDVTEEEFIQAVKAYAGEFIECQSFDGFWLIKPNGGNVCIRSAEYFDLIDSLRACLDHYLTAKNQAERIRMALAKAGAL